MWQEFPDASGINSMTGATDLDGNPKWAISPNLKHIAELGTDQASYIWGDIDAFKRGETRKAKQIQNDVKEQTIVDFDNVWKLPLDTVVQIEYQGKPWRKALLSDMEAGVIYYENLRGGGWQKKPIAPQHFRQFISMTKEKDYRIIVLDKGGFK